jgi:hypothetical protein
MRKNSYVSLCFTCHKDLVTRNWKEKIIHFWNQLLTIITQNWLSCGEHPIKSLEMKWGFIKHYVSKFCGNYHGVFILNESGSFNDNVI